MIRQFVIEKFLEDSDPIEDMGIGLMPQIKKFVKEETNYEDVESDYIWICAEHGKLEFVKYLIEKGADVDARDDAALRLASYYGHTEVVKLLLDAGADVHTRDDTALRLATRNGHTEVVKVLKDYIAKEKKVVKESLLEKFTEDSDPIEDMHIGIRSQINKFIEERDTDNEVPEYRTPACFLAYRYVDMDKDTKKEWIEYLFREGEEDFSMWEEEDVENMKRLNVRFIPNLKTFPSYYFDFKYEITNNNKYYLYTDELYNFAHFFRTNKEYDKRFIEDVLSGENYDTFRYYYDDLDTVISSLNNEEEKKLFKYLKPKCSEISELAKFTNNLSELFDIIDNETPLKQIKRYILNAYSDYIADEESNAARKDVIYKIEKNFDISEIKFDKNKELFVSKISEKGINKFFAAYWLDDDKVDYHPPYYGWNIDFNFKYFMEYIKGYISG